MKANLLRLPLASRALAPDSWAPPPPELLLLVRCVAEATRTGRVPAELSEAVDEALVATTTPAFEASSGPNDTDSVFSITRVHGDALATYALAAAASVQRVLLTSRPNSVTREALALIVYHLAGVPEIVAAAKRNGAFGADGETGRRPTVPGNSTPIATTVFAQLPRTNFFRLSAFLVELPGIRGLIHRWVTVHGLYFSVLGSLAATLHAARLLVEANEQDAAMGFLQVAEGLLRDSGLLFEIATPRGIGYRLFVRPWMRTIAPRLSGGDGLEHDVFLQAWNALKATAERNFLSPVVAASFESLRATYAVAFEQHRTICQFAVGASGSLKSRGAGKSAPAVLLALKKARVGASPAAHCPLTWVRTFFRKH